MQLHFTVRQLQLLADLLTEEKTEEDLLDRVLARDLRLDYDELERLNHLVASWRNEVIEKLQSTTKPETNVSLQQKKILLDEMQERLTEATAMV